MENDMSSINPIQQGNTSMNQQEEGEYLQPLLRTSSVQYIQPETLPSTSDKIYEEIYQDESKKHLDFTLEKPQSQLRSVQKGGQHSK